MSASLFTFSGVKRVAFVSDRSRTNIHRGFENLEDIGIDEGLATGEVILLHSVFYGFVEVGLELFESQQPKRVIFRRAGDETVMATEIAERAGDLEPERIE